MSTLSRKVGVGVMTDDQNTKLVRFINRMSKYSPAYYASVIVILISVQLDVFKESVPLEFIINSVIVISTFTIGTNVVDKILKRNRQDSRPFLYCPECPNAKMRTPGKWICEQCHKEFGEPRRDDYHDA